ncbi:uncharacterized protein LOC126904229 [Daktulosphaira vitifoliae]|uniref:uncharacterized protein LOC126904229 n=1 Tax=Daktulosphaira vitifoliae TaxID=58002 RepID=UPI0021AA15A7|nr:uncharacterized protein LOC126904229 [Daktulosphaira vitifoliae]XP_050538992.1 uncharacterized protein LOC126904229 [Daktulosphaira vitifoliae]
MQNYEFVETYIQPDQNKLFVFDECVDNLTKIEMELTPSCVLEASMVSMSDTVSNKYCSIPCNRIEEFSLKKVTLPIFEELTSPKFVLSILNLLNNENDKTATSLVDEIII